MSKKVIDSHALIVFLEKESGYEKVEELLKHASERSNPLLMSSVNYGEIYYIVLRELGEEKLLEVEKAIESLPVEIIDANLNITKEAARIKAFKKISYADCFAAALAKANKAELITGDREFKSLEREINIIWIN